MEQGYKMNDDWISFSYINDHIRIMRNHLCLLSKSSITIRRKTQIQKAQKLLTKYNRLIRRIE